MYIFFATIVFIVWLGYEIKKHDRIKKNAYQDFWENEQKANLVSRKSLDDLEYISVPMEFIPKSLLADEYEVSDCLRILKELSSKKIVNLTGYTNTELKLKYGAPNINLLSEYDDNFTVYVRTMDKLAHAYFNGGYESNARILLEKAVESKSDVKATYTLLAQIYKNHNETEKIQSLADSVDQLHSLLKEPIKAAVLEFVHTDPRSDHKSD